MANAAMSGVYGYPNVGSYGLGHSLLAWGRCHVWCTQRDIPMLAPSWLHIQHRIGPWLRKERDKRQYHRLFHFPGYVTGPRRQYLLASRRRVDAEDPALADILNAGVRCLVVFTNKMNLNEEIHFPEIVGHGRQLHQAMLAMTKPVYHPKPSTQLHVALHVRLGDFTAGNSVEALRAGAKNSRISVEWYRDMLVGLRRELGPFPAVVYSDGSDEDLAELLSMPQVTRRQKQHSITDMLGIVQASLVISSGSGFSAWGAYLGDCPRICFPGQRFARVLGEPGAIDLEPACERAEELAPAFLAAMRERLSA